MRSGVIPEHWPRRQLVAVGRTLKGERRGRMLDRIAAFLGRVSGEEEVQMRHYVVRLVAAAAGPPASEHATPVHVLFEEQARRVPARIAVRAGEQAWTYAELDDLSGRIARLLVEEHGLIPGNRVLLRGPNGYTIFAA